MAGVIPPGGDWWAESAATVITAVQVIKEQNEASERAGKGKR